MRFPYHFLLAEKHHLGDDENLTLHFISDTVKLKRINLAALVDYLATEPTYIYITSSRYTPLEINQPYVLTEAIVESK